MDQLEEMAAELLAEHIRVIREAFAKGQSENWQKKEAAHMERMDAIQIGNIWIIIWPMVSWHQRTNAPMSIWRVSKTA